MTTECSWKLLILDLYFVFYGMGLFFFHMAVNTTKLDAKNWPVLHWSLPKTEQDLEEKALLQSLLNRVSVDCQLFEADVYLKTTLGEYVGNPHFQEARELKILYRC